MRASWFKWLLIVAVLLMSGGGNAHSLADHAMPHAEPCAAHQHHHDGQQKSHPQDCCCSCVSCPAGLVELTQLDAPHPVAYSLNLAPDRAAPLASRVLSPELDPPRLSTLS